MPKLKYLGPSHFREIGKADFTSVGVDQTAIKVARHDLFPEQKDKKYDDSVEVSQEAADWLLENEKGSWEVIEEEQPESSDDESERAPAPDEGEQSSSPNASDAPDSVGLDTASRTPEAGTRARGSRQA